MKVTLSDKREPDPKRAPKAKKDKKADNSGSDASDEETQGEQQAESEEEEDDDAKDDKSETVAGGEKKKKPKSQRAKPTDNGGKTIIVSGWPQGSTKEDVKEAFTAEQRHIDSIEFPLADRSIPTAAIIFKGHKVRRHIYKASPIYRKSDCP